MQVFPLWTTYIYSSVFQTSETFLSLLKFHSLLLVLSWYIFAYYDRKMTQSLHLTNVIKTSVQIPCWNITKTKLVWKKDTFICFGPKCIKIIVYKKHLLAWILCHSKKSHLTDFPLHQGLSALIFSLCLTRWLERTVIFLVKTWRMSSK